jgi:hypothetical protein
MGGLFAVHGELTAEEVAHVFASVKRNSLG